MSLIAAMMKLVMKYNMLYKVAGGSSERMPP
jgi:hypothetical protein